MFVVGHTKKINQNELGSSIWRYNFRSKTATSENKKNGIYHPNFENVN